ncbi:MAG TPA: TetR/AcrR family transcriptional regulator [Acidobacteriaceae bacterium]|nr:TetR/AcrR family transcriptional regulator [Acidobacteriaceae bacterium]
METAQNQHESKTRLLDAALGVVREKGYQATRVEDICEAAALTKGSFFHHFKSKEELALAMLDHFKVQSETLFASAPHQRFTDPLDRLLAYIDFRRELLQGEVTQFTCLVGTMVQEVYTTHPRLREACERGITRHAAAIEPDIAAAMEKYHVHGNWTPESLALYTQAVLQGAFILAKARGGPEVARTMVDHLRRYVEMLFHRNEKQTT